LTADDRRHHLLVAGTGRAGTSALVRYLTGLGLETHISQHGDAVHWDDAAQAGLEDILLSKVTPNLPYVVKSPWSYQFVQEILDDPAIQLDGVIVPIRDLAESAASRVTRELQALHQGSPWMTQVTTWEHWGATPGGIVFSLNPIDQARLLAVGFHRLLERLVQADIPIVLVAFPRLATDPDYLHRKLAPLLPADIPVAQARAVHAATFKLENVRVERELNSEDELPPVMDRMQGPSMQVLDNAALKRELSRLRDQLSEVTAQHEALIQEGDSLRDRLAGEINLLQSQLNEAETQCTALEQAQDTLRDQLESQAARIAEAEASRTVAESERGLLRDQLQRLHEETALLREEVRALRASRSWRFTQPMRALGAVVRRGLRLRPARREPDTV